MLRKILSAAAVLIGTALAPSFAWAACSHTMVILNGVSASVNLCQGTDGSGNVYSLFGMIGGTNGANALNVNSDGTADFNLKDWGGTALGAPSAYGTSPGAVNVPGVNAYITNAPTVNLGTVSTAATAALQTTGNTTLTSINNALAAAVPSCGSKPGSCNNIGGTFNAANGYNTIAASQTAQVLSATSGGTSGITGDYLSHCTIVPATTSPGVVTILDASTAIYSFPGGASSLSNLIPFSIPIGALSVSGGWKVTTGANVSVVCVGKFS